MLGLVLLIMLQDEIDCRGDADIARALQSYDAAGRES